MLCEVHSMSLHMGHNHSTSKIMSVDKGDQFWRKRVMGGCGQWQSFRVCGAWPIEVASTECLIE